MSKYDDLVAKLKEIFQIDRPELDFGVYRILNARAGEINDYLDNRLKARVQEALVNSGNANLEQVRKELDEAEKNAQSLGMNPDDVPKVRELRQRIAELSAGSVEHENAVFSHLLTFFSRYYDSGDFISQRRYKGDTYAIPYAGEEVVLHWANKDQYYTKSGENFANYSFRLADGRTVHFRLVAADTAKDNRKDSDKERRFVLIERQTRVMTDDDGDEYEEELLPVEEANGELVIRFEYRPMPKGTKQDDLVGKAVQTVLSSFPPPSTGGGQGEGEVRNSSDAADVTPTPTLPRQGGGRFSYDWKTALSKREPTEKNPQRTLLEKHLTNYTQKNSADYFIHKDLGGFLRRELDFYIKNEVMHLDDMQNAERFADIEKNLRMIQCLRAIALDLITFLAQLEDFQKKLWEKKKFVVAAHYCITLDRVIKDAPELLDTIAANERQWEQWENWGMLKPGALRDGEYLKAHPFLMADTALFEVSFKDKLLGSIDHLEESLDGLLIHGDNFQALRLLQEHSKANVNCICIDPPYNTGSDGFCYKDSYQDSSWLAQQHQTLPLAKQLLAETGSLFTFSDENETHQYAPLLYEIFGEQNLVETLIWNKRVPKNDKGIGNIHDFVFLLCNNLMARRQRDLAYHMRKDELDEIYDLVNKCKAQGKSLSETQAGLKKFYRKQGYDRGITLYCELDSEYRIWGKINMSWPNPKTEGPRYEVINPVTGKAVPIPKNGWRWKEETFRKAESNGPCYKLPDGSMMKGRIWYAANDKTQPSSITYLDEVQSFLLRSILSVKSDGSLTLENLGLGGLIDYPKPVLLLERLIHAIGENDGFFFDYFAGSGTTGHAVMSLNRQDQGKRKYILVEQGEYFDTVLKPRIQKVVYSADWKDGKAMAPETGISHAFKVLKIESYEDTLNNLELRRSEQQQNLLDRLGQEAKDDYLLRYMLDIESRGSILSVNSFRKPFDCTLKVAVDSAGAWEERTIDLVETFNYLIGLKVKQIDSLRERGIVMVQGALPTGEKTLILWRDCEQVDYEALNRFCDSHAINPRDSEFEVVYINGDHNIPSVLTTTEDEGGITKILKLRQIEPEFLSRMFDGDV